MINDLGTTVGAGVDVTFTDTQLRNPLTHRSPTPHPHLRRASTYV